MLGASVRRDVVDAGHTTVRQETAESADIALSPLSANRVLTRRSKSTAVRSPRRRAAQGTRKKCAQAMAFRPRVHDRLKQISRDVGWVIFGIYVIDTPRPIAVDLNNGFFIREGIVRHAGLEREEASSR
jgi:hypothetical protein